MVSLLTINDFEKLGQIAAHCDTKKLAVAVNQAAEFDMERIFCGLWIEAEAKWTSTDTSWRNLINGTEYIGCKNSNRRHKGLKDALIYFSFARYTYNNGFNDTPSGNVQKTNDFSIPKPLKEVKDFADQYRNMAYQVVKGLKNWLCLQDKTTFPAYERDECEPCGCAGECGGPTTTTGYGIRSKNISKWDA